VGNCSPSKEMTMDYRKLSEEKLAEMCAMAGKNTEGRTKEQLIAILRKRDKQHKEEEKANA